MEEKKLRVVFLSEFVGIINRGVETYVLELSSRLQKNYDVEILSGEDANSISKIVNGKYDFVIATNGRLQSLKASIGRMFANYRLVISGQAGVGTDDLWNIILCRPDKYVALTDFELDWAKKYTQDQKLAKIPNGVDLSKFSPVGSKIKFGLSGPIILSVGALFWYKHHELSIKAVESMNEGALVIIGSGPEKQNLEKVGAKLLNLNRLKILEVDYQRIAEFYRSANVFVLPSWQREAFGIVYLEAMASGVPVVAPNDLSRKEIIGDAGLLVDVNDIRAYSDAIQICLNTKWGDKPRNQASKFSWDIITDEYKKLFEKLV